MALAQVGGGISSLGSMGNTESKGQVDSFLKLDGTPGDATADGHTNEIELTGWHFGGTNAGGFGVSGPGGGAGKVHFWRQKIFGKDLPRAQAPPS